MEVLVTGGDTVLGRTVADGFRSAGHNLTLAGRDRDAVKDAAKQLNATAVACDTADPHSLTDARGSFPHHLDAIINVPSPRGAGKDPRTYSLADHAAAWRSALDATVVSVVLTLQAVGDHLRSGGSIISVIPENPAAGSAPAAIKAALTNWTAGQSVVFGTRGITVNVVAAGGDAAPSYDGLIHPPPSTAEEVARLALFLTTPAARHITGETLHVSQGVLTRFG